MKLPRGATLFGAWVGGRGLSVAKAQRGDEVRVPLAGPAAVELAYTFAAEPIGIRGRYHVELPHLPVPVRGARWQVWLPSGLRYGATQASLAPAGGCVQPAPARATLDVQGECHAFARPVLEPGRAYVEGTYEQPL